MEIPTQYSSMGFGLHLVEKFMSLCTIHVQDIDHCQNNYEYTLSPPWKGEFNIVSKYHILHDRGELNSESEEWEATERSREES